MRQAAERGRNRDGSQRRLIFALPAGQVVHDVADLVGAGVILQVDHLLYPAQRHHSRALGTGFERRIEGYVLEGEGTRFLRYLAARSPAIADVGQAKKAPHHARLGMLGRTSKEVVVIEFEVDDLALPVDGQARDVVPEISIPVYAQRIRHRRIEHVASISAGDQLLLFSAGIFAQRPPLVAVPEAADQLHQQEAVDAMPLPADFRIEVLGYLAGSPVDVDHVADRAIPIFRQVRAFVQGGQVGQRQRRIRYRRRDDCWWRLTDIRHRDLRRLAPIVGGTLNEQRTQGSRDAADQAADISD